MSKVAKETQETEEPIDQQNTEAVIEETNGTHEDASVDKSSESTEVVEKDPLEQLQEALNNSQTQLKTEKEQSLRAMAELENFKKRKEQEVQNFKRYANEGLITDLLVVLDSFYLAAAHNGTSETDTKQEKEDSVSAGVSLILKQFESSLTKNGVKEIECENKPFDPNFHQAVSQEEREGVEEGVVLQVMQRGYLLHDRVIRPAMVIVSK